MTKANQNRLQIFAYFFYELDGSYKNSYFSLIASLFLYTKSKKKNDKVFLLIEKVQYYNNEYKKSIYLLCSIII